MNHLFLVALGGGLGAAGRHLVNLAALRTFGPGFPAGTLTVNVLGSLAMGLLVGWLASRPEGVGSGLRLFLATGFLGGFTTFSAFSLDAVTLWERGEATTALAYAAVSVIVSILALLAGLMVMRTLTAG
ncbi:fluoride efflux transporter CrcB [Stappia indica]|uniref:fluoride efflux transporter CrcB n=1 Tax=Stappia indica TaxID=538381 RepID=UPI00082E46AF|nr:fluoride efflux transporter CrcB [Stappia indica]